MTKPGLENVPEPFASVDGVRFLVEHVARDRKRYGPVGGFTGFVLRAGVYPSGHGAIQVFCDDGEPDCKLTVNLVPYGAAEREPHEFYSKVEEVEARMRDALFALGVFESTGEWVDQGFVKRYADVWRFASCPRMLVSAEHNTPTGTAMHAASGVLAVRCPGCHAAWAKDYKSKTEKMLARDAVDRLKGEPPP